MRITCLFAAAILFTISAQALHDNLCLLGIVREAMPHVWIGSKFPTSSALDTLEKIHPVRAMAGYRAVAAYARRTSNSEAEKIWRLALKRSPGDWLSAGQLGLELESQGSLLEAEPFLLEGQLAIVVAWRRVEAGQASINKKDFSSAVTWLTNGLHLGDLAVVEPMSSSSSWWNSFVTRWRKQRYAVLRDIGVAYQNSSAVSEAVRYYRWSLQEHQSAYTSSMLAQALMSSGCSSEAITLLRSLQAYPMALRLLAWAEAQCGNYEAAVQAGREATRSPTTIPVDQRYEFGFVLWSAGYTDEALNEWRLALRASPRHPYRSLIPPAAWILLNITK